jgi:transketolase|tara:strand:+ start:143 stop:910 length:768 start_codon:yes stop_codon:yes gene_type:complete
MNNKELEKIAKSVRKTLFEIKTRDGIGHLHSSLSCVDILVSLFYDDRTNFNHEKDIVLFGKAHGSPSIYPILADLEYFPKEELDKYCRPGGILRLHSDASIPGCHFVGGSLGNGIGYASGLALANRDKNYYIIMGDSELYEGSVWESLIFISHHNLTNLKIIVDRNGLGTIGETEKMLKLEPLEDKFKSFVGDVKTINGHDFDALRDIFSNDIPQAIIADTIKGKGVSYMEGKWKYHVVIPSSEEDIKTGLEELS